MSNRMSINTVWVPSVIDTLAWYDASDEDTITEVGNAVSQWNDKSGNDRHATQSTEASKPTNDVTIGGKTALDFDGTDDFFSVASGIPISGDVLVVGVAHRYSAGDNLIIDGYDGGGWNYSYWWYTDNIIYTYLWNTTGDVEGNADTTIGDFLLTAQKKYNDVANNYVNGTLHGTLDITGFSESPNPLTELGRYGGSVESRMKLGEVIYLQDITETTRQKIEGYLAWKWNLVGNLPIGHPYKTARPTY